MELLIVVGLIVAGLIFAYREVWREYQRHEILPLSHSLDLLRSEIAAAEARLHSAREKGFLFSRDFQSEIQAQESKKSAGYIMRNAVKDQRREAFAELRRVRDKLSDWHRRSRGTFLGNGRRKIKDDSVLGWFGLEQTKAQKESMERDRDRISARISRLDKEMDDIYLSEIAPCKKALNRIWDDKRSLQSLWDARHDQAYFECLVRKEEALIDDRRRKIASLEATINQRTMAFQPFKRRRKTVRVKVEAASIEDRIR